MRYMLDSTFLIDHLRADAAALARFEKMFQDGDEPIVVDVVVCEVATGAPSHPDPDLTALLEPVEFVQPGPDAALLAGEWRATARRGGHQLSLPDALIAAAAHAVDAVVLTRNLHDFALTGARVEAY
ncbi:MAG: PIN domain-containing protein [Chloroflexota bacterium]